MSVRIVGAEELARGLDSMAAEAGRLRAFDELGQQSRDSLAELSPRRTGTLAGSWQIEGSLSRVAVGSDLVYAAVQDRGGYHNITGKRFVEQTATKITGLVGPAVTEELDGLIRRL